MTSAIIKHNDGSITHVHGPDDTTHHDETSPLPVSDPDSAIARLSPGVYAPGDPVEVD